MSEPTVLFVISRDNWHNKISALSKLDLLDIVPHMGVQFGYDLQSQAFMVVVVKSKWAEVPQAAKQKFMMISRRLKEEMEGPMSTTQREKYETTDLFAVFEEVQQLEPIDEEPTSS